MTKFCCDTSVLVAAFSSWHSEHRRALEALEELLAQRSEFCVVNHTVFETYSVLTRLPAPHRLSHSDAWSLVSQNLLSQKLLQLGTQSTASLLHSLASQQIGGGRVYDALIAATAKDGGVGLLLTLNLSHFRDFADGGFNISTP